MRTMLAAAFLSMSVLAVPAFADELAFTTPPDGVPDASSWASGTMEGPLAHNGVPAALALGNDFILNELVERHICSKTEDACSFRVRYQMRDQNPKDPESTILMRYVFLAPDGTRFEGLALSPSRHPLIYHLFTRLADGWNKWLPTGDEYKQQLRFTFVLSLFMGEMQKRGILVTT
ncbi:MAG TPA: hypothetical protein VMJ72_00190 [Candidatus Paceibacterota bacterium]|nr:hypothetical protein [Candidatus Paceibacterota bacterium]